MITYKNISFSTKTFYGVKFKPGEIKSVPGYINSFGMVRVSEPKPATSKPKFFDIPVAEPTKVRKKKSTESEKVEVAETKETKISSEEETSDGNPS